MGATAGAIKTRNPKFLAPLWPIGIMYWFQSDMTNGVIMNRAIREADDILAAQPDYLRMPGGMPSMEDFEKK